MTSIKMSQEYVATYEAWKGSDAIVAVGFGFGSDDEHINGLLRTLIADDNKKLIVVTLSNGSSEDSTKDIIATKYSVGIAMDMCRYKVLATMRIVLGIEICTDYYHIGLRRVFNMSEYGGVSLARKTKTYEISVTSQIRKFTAMHLLCKIARQ